MFLIIGSIVVLLSVCVGFIGGGGSLLLLWHPLEVLIICGAAAGAFVISNPPKVVKASLSGVVALLKPAKYKKEDYVDLFKLMYDILVKARKEGMLAIESHIDDPHASSLFSAYPRVLADQHMTDFMTDCLRLMIGGNLDPHELESLLETELETHHHESTEPAHAMQKVADGLPGFGIVAAVLGIVSTMSQISGADTATIGEHVGAALVGTFLGILVAYGFIGPIAAAMEQRASEDGKAFELVKMAFVASVRGYAPPVAIEFARKLLYASLRPSFADLESHLKGK
jgi:chemotaxis protein MotA